jgi:hypothetical protein
MDRELKCLDCESNDNEEDSKDPKDIKNINIEIQGNIKTQVNRA